MWECEAGATVNTLPNSPGCDGQGREVRRPLTNYGIYSFQDMRKLFDNSVYLHTLTPTHPASPASPAPPRGWPPPAVAPPVWPAGGSGRSGPTPGTGSAASGGTAGGAPGIHTPPSLQSVGGGASDAC